MNIRALQTPLKPEGLYLDEPRRLHHWDLGARPPTIYVFSDERRIDATKLVEAFGEFIVAVGRPPL